MKKGLLFFLLLALWCVPKADAQYRAQATLDSAEALIGSPLRLRLDIGPLPAGTPVEWPQMPDSFRALARAGEAKTDTVGAGGEVRYLREYPFVGLDSGNFEVPALSFRVGGQAVQTAPASIHLYPPDVDTSKPIDPIRDIIAAPAYVNWKPWAIAAGVLVLLALAAWLWLRRKKKPVAAPVVKIPPQGFASLLKELEAEGLPQKGEYRLYYTRLTDILRDAIAVRTGLHAREMTSAQLLRKTGKTFNELSHQQLRAILQEADGVKFAKLQPAIPMQEAVMQTAFAFLQNARL